MSVQLPVLEVDIAHVDEACVVQVQGELDIAGCPSVELALEGAELTEAKRLVLDLEHLKFIDAMGLRVILRASRRSASNGDRLQITRGRGQVARLFRLTELDTVLPLIDASRVPRSRPPAARFHLLSPQARLSLGSSGTI